MLERYAKGLWVAMGPRIRVTLNKKPAVTMLRRGNIHARFNPHVSTLSIQFCDENQKRPISIQQLSESGSLAKCASGTFRNQACTSF
jgi:hypothetical protein